MARPKKNTVDYFPHDCHWSKALEIFINKHANEGYAFYYRLFEQLGVSPDHKYDCSKSIDNQYLASKTGVTEEKMSQYIKDLVSIGVIDEDYWKKRIIWVQSFVDSVAEVYKSRTTELPTKESFQAGNEGEAVFPAGKQGFSAENRGFLARNSQSKVKDSKVNNSRGEKSNHSLPIEDLNELHKAFTGKANTTPTKTEISIYRGALKNKSINEWIPYCKERLKRQTSGSRVPAAKFFFDQDYTKFEQVQRNQNEKPTHTTLYCVNCKSPKQVPANKTYGHLCGECGDQMVNEHELKSFRTPLIKRKNNEVKSN